MPVARKPPKASSVADDVLETSESSVLDLIDSLLNKGVMANGDVTLGVAGVDLIYLRLSSILCAADRILAPQPDAAKKPRPKRRGRS